MTVEDNESDKPKPIKMERTKRAFVKAKEILLNPPQTTFGTAPLVDDGIGLAAYLEWLRVRKGYENRRLSLWFFALSGYLLTKILSLYLRLK